MEIHQAKIRRKFCGEIHTLIVVEVCTKHALFFTAEKARQVCSALDVNYYGAGVKHGKKQCVCWLFLQFQTDVDFTFVVDQIRQWVHSASRLERRDLRGT